MADKAPKMPPRGMHPLGKKALREKMLAKGGKVHMREAKARNVKGY